MVSQAGMPMREGKDLDVVRAPATPEIAPPMTPPTMAEQQVVAT